MKKRFSKLIRNIVHRILGFLFPSRYYNRFIKVKDDIAQKPFEIYLRKDSFIEAVILSKGLYGKWEKESLKIWAVLSKKAHTILDIGANTGIYSLIAQNNNSKAKIIAIEPVDTNFMVLSSNIQQNNFSIHPEKVALSDKDGTAKMFMLKDKLNYMTSVNDDRYAIHPEIKGNLEVVEIDVPIKQFSYIQEKYSLQNIDLIKIDVEGHELTVLKDMMPYIEKYKPVILIEIIGAENAKILDTMFKPIGYSYISINEESKSFVTEKLWDNDHHNFLICNKDTVKYLQKKELVV